MTRDLFDRVEAFGKRLRQIFAGPNTPADEETTMVLPREPTPTEQVHEAVGELRSSAQHLKAVAHGVVEQNGHPDSFERDMVRLLGRIQ